jgi:hypothetical protein
VPSRSDALDRHSLRVCSQRLQIIRISREHCAPRLGHCNNESVDCRASTSPPPEKCCTPSETLGDLFDDVAGLEQLVLRRVAPRMSLQALDQNHRRNGGRPETFLPQRQDQCRRIARTFSKTADGARVQYQQALTDLAGRAPGDALRQSLGARSFARTGLTHFSEQSRRVSIGLRKQVETSHLCSHSALQ